MAEMKPKRFLCPSHWTLRQRFDRYADKSGGVDACWPWLAHKLKRGYGHLGYEGKMLKAHRVSWELENGPIPSRMLVCHRCDNPSCVNPAHLFLGTSMDNNHDMISKDRHWRGHLATLNAHARVLTEEQVRTLRNTPGSNKALGAMFGIGAGQVYKIRRFQQWADLEGSNVSIVRAYP